jgi:hypothetical protein
VTARRDMSRYKVGRDITREELVDRAKSMDIGDALFVEWPRSSVQYRLKQDLPDLPFSIRQMSEGVLVIRKESHDLHPVVEKILKIEPGSSTTVDAPQPRVYALLSNPRCYVPKNYPSRRFRTRSVRVDDRVLTSVERLA